MTAKSETTIGIRLYVLGHRHTNMPPHNVDRKPSSSIVDLKDVIMRQSIRTAY